MGNAVISVDNFGMWKKMLDFGFDKRVMSTAKDDDIWGLVDTLKEFV